MYAFVKFASRKLIIRKCMQRIYKPPIYIFFFVKSGKQYKKFGCCSFMLHNKRRRRQHQHRLSSLKSQLWQWLWLLSVVFSFFEMKTQMCHMLPDADFVGSLRASAVRHFNNVFFFCRTCWYFKLNFLYEIAFMMFMQTFVKSLEKIIVIINEWNFTIKFHFITFVKWSKCLNQLVSGFLKVFAMRKWWCKNKYLSCEIIFESISFKKTKKLRKKSFLSTD